MVRRYKEVTPGKIVVVDILCDRCGNSTRTLSGYEKANLTASFEEGFHAGDRFVVELCSQCFDEMMQNILVDNMGTCLYHSEVLAEDLELDDLREMYAHLQAGTMIFDEDDIPDFDEDWDEEECEEEYEEEDGDEI